MMQSVTPNRILPPGTVLHDTYRIVRDYGAGSGGIVYLAHHLRLDKTVIVKQMKAEISHVVSHEADVQNLKNLHHSYLPQVYDLLVEDGGVFTVMEYIEGKTLQRMLDDGRKFRQSEVVRWGTQLAEVVKYLHTRERAIIHRDIKPDNIIITPGGDICLIDFNVAFAMGDDQRFNAHTDGYAPIEQYAVNVRRAKPSKPTRGGTIVDPVDESIRGTMLESIIRSTVVDEPDPGTVLDDPLKGGTILDDPLLDAKPKKPDGKISPVDERADIYSIGATLYHLALGVMPAPATEKVKPISAYENANLGDALVAIIEKCMQRDRTKRYQSAAALHKAFLNIKKADSRYRRFRFRYNLASIVVAAMLVVSASMTAYGWRLMQSESGSRFDSYIADARTACMAGDFSRAETLCDQADAIKAGTVEVTAERVLIDFYRLDYQTGLDRALAFRDTYIPREDKYAVYSEVLYAAGLCAFNLDRMDYAASLIREAITYNDGNPEYYCDLAIILARQNDAEAARQMLERAASMSGEGTARIALVSGEVALVEGKSADAVAYMQEAIEKSGNEYDRYRAYMLSAHIYSSAADVTITDGVALLETAVDAYYGTGYESSLRLALADLSSRAAQVTPTRSVELYRTALSHYTVLISEGFADLTTSLNASLAAMVLDEFSQAKQILTGLGECYPNEYRIWKLLAFLAVEMQDCLDVKQRDYGEFTEYYAKACAGYEQRRLTASGFFDTEMQMLDNLAGDLRDNNWIE